MLNLLIIFRLSQGFKGVLTSLQGSFLQHTYINKVSRTMFLYLGQAAKQAFSYRGAVMRNGLENELKDEINLNSFNSALTLS